MLYRQNLSYTYELGKQPSLKVDRSTRKRLKNDFIAKKSRLISPQFHFMHNRLECYQYYKHFLDDTFTQSLNFEISWNNRHFAHRLLIDRNPNPCLTVFFG